MTNDTSGCIVLGNGGFDTNGILGGGQLGYMTAVNLGSGWPLMVGGEIDLQGSGVSGSQNVSGPLQLVGLTETCSPCSYTASQKIDWFGTLRARVGVPVDRFLIYGTGGLIVGAVTTSQSLNFGTTPGNVGNAKSTLSGPDGRRWRRISPSRRRLVGQARSALLRSGNRSTVALPHERRAVNFSDYKTFGFRGAMIRLGVNFPAGRHLEPSRPGLYRRRPQAAGGFARRHIFALTRACRTTMYCVLN